MGSKFVFTFLLFTAMAMRGHGQEMIANGSFEQNTACPSNFFSAFAGVADWFAPAGSTPDYFHPCGIAALSVPTNLNGHQRPKDGLAYAGIALLYGGQDGRYCREHFQSRLADPLHVGRTYRLVMYVALAGTSAFATDEVSAYLSEDSLIGITTCDTALPLPQAQRVQTLMLNDTLGWTRLEMEFVADLPYQYITVGNFDSAPSIQHMGGPAEMSYYYFDALSLQEVPQDTAGEIMDDDAQLVMPNVISFNNDNKNDDLTPIVYRNISQASIEVYSRWGKKVYDSHRLYPPWSPSEVPGGHYFYRVTYMTQKNSTLAAKGWVSVVK